ncbi:MAG: hypothetical protein SOU51_03770 [Collinsella sp.]|nr:hypothetical protein [Collinsella sp.]
MSTRSPMNKRNQEREGSGMTRKSAASAKPARAAAASVRVVPASSKEKRRQLERGEDLSGLSREEKKARKKELRLREDRIYTAANVLMKQDEDYMKRRKIFWVAMVLGLVFIAIGWSFLMLFGDTPNKEYQTLEIVAIALAYACIIGGFIYDMVRIRPIRNRCRATAEGMSESKLTDVLENAASKDEQKRAEREAKKLARKGK